MKQMMRRPRPQHVVAAKVRDDIQPSAPIAALRKALVEAERKLAEQSKQIARLKSEVVFERDLRSKAEKLIREARQELVDVEKRLDVPFPDPCGGA